MRDAPELIAIARIIKPRGIRGEVVADALTDRADRWTDLQRLRVETPRGESFDLELERARVSGHQVLLLFRSCRTRAEAERLRGSWVKAPPDPSPSPDPDTFYHYQLLECTVRTTSGETVGRVHDVLETGGVPLLEVIGQDGHHHLIPFATTICPTVDVAARLIVIDPPEGLLELNRSDASL
ncbi:MAG TPA: ribosome maturation factor RimM [Blastocatellia bacterium]|nr:ribosome maturation factor RimM [Blastocatellia bacterium]